MKWPFLKGLASRKTSDKCESKKSRLRYRRTRLLDLLCTIKSRALLRDSPSSSVSRLTDICSSQECSVPSDLSNSESMSDLWRSHSLALRRPIPVRSTIILRNKDLVESSSAKVCSTQPAFCPSCRNVVIPLPQKRQSSHDDCEQQPDAKRIKSCFNSTHSVLLHHGPAELEPIYRRGTVGYLNPTYESVNIESDDSVYSTIASDSASSYSSSSASFPTRPKVFARRRCTNYNGINKAELERWLCEGSVVADELNQTYAVIDPYPSNNYTALHTEHAFVLGDPLISSTLQRERKSCIRDNETVYDEVACSDTETDSVPGSNMPPSVARNKRRRRLCESPDQPYDAVKRVRREYFICEE